MIPIVFIHGFSGGRYEFKPIIRFLRKKRDYKIYEFTYKKKWGQVSLTKISEDFQVFINEKVKEKKINVIGISQGGIIAKYYSDFLNKGKKRIIKFISLCTPFNGSIWGYLSLNKGIKELKPSSRLLKMLNKKKEDNIKYYSVYNPLDLVVIPGKSAKNNKGRNLRVFSILHQFTFWNKKTLNFIYESLEE